MRLVALCLLLVVMILPAVADGQEGYTYTSDQIRRTPAETFLERMLTPEPGYWQFAALNALAQKARESTPEARARIQALVTAAMYDERRPVQQRFQCCYVLAGSGDDRGLPDIAQVLLHDPSETMRAVAAEALGKSAGKPVAHQALLQAARQETSPWVRETLARYLGDEMPPPPPAALAPPPEEAAPPADEWAPQGPPQPPPGPKRPVAEPLPWPFPGGQQDQAIMNNYQEATDDYIHGGLDFIHPAGTPVTAVASGYVSYIFTMPAGTHDSFVITPEPGGDEGWCYTHLDASTFTFQEGDFIEQGQVLGSLVKFSVDGKPGLDHLHLHYVRFTRKGPKFHSLIDPLYFFDWKDTVAPTFKPLRFVAAGTTREFTPGADGVITVSGRVDVLAAIADCAYPGHRGGWGVPVVMVSISDGTHTVQALVLDHRGDVGNERQVKPLYLSREEERAFFNPDPFPRYQMLRVTATDGDGKITPNDVGKCWDTTARNPDGSPFWPNGDYSVNVYAWDIAGNRGAAGAAVRVKNE